MIPGVWSDVEENRSEIPQQLIRRYHLHRPRSKISENGCFEEKCYLAALRQPELAAEAEHVDDADEGTGPVTVLGHHAAHAPAVADKSGRIS